MTDLTGGEKRRILANDSNKGNILPFIIPTRRRLPALRELQRSKGTTGTGTGTRPRPEGEVRNRVLTVNLFDGIFMGGEEEYEWERGRAIKWARWENKILSPSRGGWRPVAQKCG